MIQNIVIGKPIVDVKLLLAKDDKDWEENEKTVTMFTDNRFLPAVLKEAGIVQSTSEVKRNRPDLMITLDKMDCFSLKIGKKKVFIVVGQ